MSKTMEQACRAICHSRKFETGEGTCALRCMEHLGCARDKCAHVDLIHGDLARLVISAIREPDEEMKEAAATGIDSIGQGVTTGDAHKVWQAMIDQLLKI